MGEMRFGHEALAEGARLRARVKAGGVADDGTFEGYGSVFGVVDSYQEIVAPGAFTESLAELAAKGASRAGAVAAPQRSADRRL
jgi:hypothetical protein